MILTVGPDPVAREDALEKFGDVRVAAGMEELPERPLDVLDRQPLLRKSIPDLLPSVVVERGVRGEFPPSLEDLSARVPKPLSVPSAGKLVDDESPVDLEAEGGREGVWSGGEGNVVEVEELAVGGEGFKLLVGGAEKHGSCSLEVLK